MDVVEKLYKLYRSVSKGPPTPTLFHALMNACKATGDFDQVEPTSHTFKRLHALEKIALSSVDCKRNHSLTRHI